MEREEVNLAQVLDAKEKRFERQQRLLHEYGLPLVSLTINMPGAIKDLPVLRRLCEYGVREISRRFPIVASQTLYLPTGPEALLVVRENPEDIKGFAVHLEESHDFGRLLDMDVFDEKGALLSRKNQGQGRTCFICGNEAAVCMRTTRHGKEDLQQAVYKRIHSFLAWETRSVSPQAEKIGAIGLESMLFEAACTPAPGLVDRVNSGAHRDMDFYTFMASSAALAFSMARCAQAGIFHRGAIQDLLPVLRRIGIEGETSMFEATRGVNTQKGLLFILGILAGAAGYGLSKSEELHAKAILSHVSAMVSGIVERELASIRQKPKEALTFGERLYLDYGVTGIRGEMEQGLPAVALYGLPALKDALAKGLTVNDALVHALLVLMTCVEDTTVMHRHHPDKLHHWMRPKVQVVLDKGSMFTEEGREALQELDKLFIKENVSPGGAADLLAAVWFLYKINLIHWTGGAENAV